MATPPRRDVEGLRYEIGEGIATITLDRPDALNSLTVPLKLGLRAAFERAGGDSKVRVVILTGAGRAFCAGQDLAEDLEQLPVLEELVARVRALLRRTTVGADQLLRFADLELGDFADAQPGLGRLAKKRGEDEPDQVHGRHAARLSRWATTCRHARTASVPGPASSHTLVPAS